MTIDEKLQHFYEVSLDEAREDAAKAIQDHKAYLEQVLEEHKQSRTQTAEAEVKAEAEHVRREVNKALSAEQITLKRDWSLRQNELKESLFAEVRDKALRFTSTPEYSDYLCRRIKEAKDFAEDDEIQIYLSAGDKDTNQELIRYDLGEDFSIETAIVVGELYKHNGEWKFNAIGSGFQGGLAALCGHYGIEVA